MTTPTTHPHWCGEAHVCSIDRPGGEHRSHPLTVDTAQGRIVATRIRTGTGRDRIEVRTVFDLPADPDQAQRMARTLMLRLHQVLQRADAGQGGPSMSERAWWNWDQARRLAARSLVKDGPASENVADLADWYEGMAEVGEGWYQQALHAGDQARADESRQLADKAALQARRLRRGVS